MNKLGKKISNHQQISFTDSKPFNKFSLVSSVLSGTSGGALIGASFGVIGSIIGSIFGGFVTGYSGYKDELKRVAKG